jgi:hypothetical protein
VSDADRESGQLWFGEAHTLGQDDAEAIEESGLWGVGLCDAA